jgi:hypothetical protein
MHLAAGQRVKWSFERITDKNLRQRYMDLQKKLTPGKEVKETDLVKLDCASCHRLDTTDDPGRKEPARAAGDYMLPTTYEQHCKACHPLTFSAELPGVEVPHHLQPSEVKSFLWGVFTEREKRLQQADLKSLTGDRPLPGKNQSREQLRKKIEKSVSGGTDVLFENDLKKANDYVLKGKATCGLCHFYETKPGLPVPEKILPVNVPEVWYPHAKFSHRAHRAVDCAECHKNVDQSETQRDILLPGTENCVSCHSPARVENGKQKGGVRQDCVTCHRYHHNDQPLAGRGAAARGVDVRKTLEDFLRAK